MSKLVVMVVAGLVFGASSWAVASESAGKQPAVKNPLMPNAAKALSRKEAARIVGHGETSVLFYALPEQFGSVLLPSPYPVPITTIGTIVPPTMATGLDSAHNSTPNL